MTALGSLPNRVRFRAVTWISTRPELYYGIRHLLGHADPLCVRPDTSLVIEGFPRSANSTTVYGFLARQDRQLHVAHHKHHAAQILRAAAWGIPAVVLIRTPRAACLSFLALAAEARHRAGKPESEGLAFSDVLAAYVVFYEAVEPTLDHTVIGQFECVRDDLEGLVERVNARFGTDFQTQATYTAPKSELGWHAMPNDVRDRIKHDLEVRFTSELDASPALRRLLARAGAVHARYGEADDRAG